MTQLKEQLQSKAQVRVRMQSKSLITIATFSMLS